MKPLTDKIRQARAIDIACQEAVMAAQRKAQATSDQKEGMRS